MANGINVEIEKHKSNDMFPNITTIYFDMDGVLADFAKGAERVGAWKKNEEGVTELDWEPIYEEGEDFWANLDWTPGGRELFERVNAYAVSKNCQVCILSAVHYKEGIDGKKTWLSKNLPKTKNKIKAYFTKDGNEKAGYISNVGKFADEDCVLIDDFGSNCKFFRSHGGQAIKYSGNVNYVMSELKKMFEWDIHEKYLKNKVNHILNEVDCDFESFKKKSTINEDIIGNIANFADRNIRKGANAIGKKVGDAIEKDKQERYEASRAILKDLNNGEGLTIKASTGDIVYLVRRDRGYYIALPNRLAEVTPKQKSEGDEKLIEAYKNKKFFIKCSSIEGTPKKATDKDEKLAVYKNGQLKIYLDTESMNSPDNKLTKYIYQRISTNFVFKVVDFKKTTFNDICKEFYKTEWFQNYLNKAKENKLDVYNINEVGYAGMKKVFQELDHFNVSLSNDVELEIIKDNDTAYVKMGDVNRPVKLTKSGLVVAFY